MTINEANDYFSKPNPRFWTDGEFDEATRRYENDDPAWADWCPPRILRHLEAELAEEA